MLSFSGLYTWYQVFDKCLQNLGKQIFAINVVYFGLFAWNQVFDKCLKMLWEQKFAMNVVYFGFPTWNQVSDKCLIRLRTWFPVPRRLNDFSRTEYVCTAHKSGTIIMKSWKYTLINSIIIHPHYYCIVNSK